MNGALFQKEPIIAAVKDDSGLREACNSQIETVFLLYGNILDLQLRARQLKEAGKRVFIHIDLVEGLKTDRQGMRYIARVVQPFGIISTKPSGIKLAREYGLKGVLRIFLIDASALETGRMSIRSAQPDLVELMPGLLPSIIREFSESTEVPVVAGGMIRTTQEVQAAIRAGAVAISTSNRSLWRKM